MGTAPSEENLTQISGTDRNDDGSADRQRAATLHDVAAAVGVSPRTVSRVVNDETGFSEETRKRVLDAVDDLGYRPNVFARGLITQRSRTMGFIIPLLTDPFFAELVDGVQRAAREAGLTTLFALSDGDPEIEQDVMAQLGAYRPDGLIVFPADLRSDHLIAELDDGRPMVFVDAEVDHPNAASVISDLGLGAKKATQHLLSRGCRRPAMLACNVADRDCSRQRGFIDVVTAAGIEPNIVEVPPTMLGGERGAAQLLAIDPAIDGLFCYNDLLAIGAMQTFRAIGMSVPNDVAVIGCDDISMGTVVTPTLSTIRIDGERLGAEAVSVMGALVNGERGLDPVVLSVDLVLRESA